MNFRENPQWRIPKRGRRGQRPETPLLYFFCPFCMFPISFFGCLILTLSMSLTSIFSGSEIGLTKICLLATTETLMQIRWDTLKQSFKSNHLLNQSPDSTSESWFHNCVYLPFHETRWNCLFNLGWFFWVYSNCIDGVWFRECFCDHQWCVLQWGGAECVIVSIRRRGWGPSVLMLHWGVSLTQILLMLQGVSLTQILTHRDLQYT